MLNEHVEIKGIEYDGKICTDEGLQEISNGIPDKLFEAEAPEES